MMDEHDPLYQPKESWEEDIPGAHWALIFVAIALVLALLTGCDDLDRRLAEQQFREKVFNLCVPEEGQRVVVVRDEDSLHFTRIDLSAGRYSRKFPHAEVRVSTLEGL